MIVGTSRFEAEFRRKIVDRHVFQKRCQYVSRMRREIDSRHSAARAMGRELSSVKDGVGSVRDITMLLDMYKAAYGLYRTVNAQLLTDLARLEPTRQRELRFLGGALEFFKNLRNAYRVAVGAEDKLRREYFHVVAQAMGLSFGDDEEARERLMRSYRGCTVEVGEIVGALAADLEARCASAGGEGLRAHAREAKPQHAGTGPTWRGAPRREVPWYPTIDTSRCNGCGACEAFCSFGVLDRSRDGVAVRVRRRYACVVGCDLCAQVCPQGAISFPGLSVVRELPDTSE
jgi:NAD-dependent dihydropyrimidine dehydrogenase PreA subunit